MGWLPFFHFPTCVHNGCTSYAPCGVGDGGLVSMGGKPAIGPLGERFWPANFGTGGRVGDSGPAEGEVKPARRAAFRGIPQEFRAILKAAVCNTSRNRSICDDNTICCALYLTHPTGGGTFTCASRNVSGSKVTSKSGRQSSPRYFGRAVALSVAPENRAGPLFKSTRGMECLMGGQSKTGQNTPSPGLLLRATPGNGKTATLQLAALEKVPSKKENLPR